MVNQMMNGFKFYKEDKFYKDFYKTKVNDIDIFYLY